MNTDKSNKSPGGKDNRDVKPILDQDVVKKMRQNLDQEERAIAKMRECLNEIEKENSTGINGNEVPAEENPNSNNSKHDNGTENRKPTKVSSEEIGLASNTNEMKAANNDLEKEPYSLDSPETFNLDLLHETTEGGNNNSEPFGNIHEIVAHMREFVKVDENDRINEEERQKREHDKRMKELESNITESTKIRQAKAAKKENERAEYDNDNKQAKNEEQKDGLSERSETSDTKRSFNEKRDDDDQSESSKSREGKEEQVEKPKINKSKSKRSTDEDGHVKYDIDDSDEIVKMSTHGGKSVTKGSSESESENEAKKKEAKGFMNKMKGLLSTRD